MEVAILTRLGDTWLPWAEQAKAAAIALLSPTSAAAHASGSAFDDPFADVVASDRDILAQFEPANDVDVLF